MRVTFENSTRRIGLFQLLTLLTSASAFVAPSGGQSSNKQTLTYHQPSADGTSLHVGVAYGPPIFSETTSSSSSSSSFVGVLSRSQNYYNSNWKQPFDIDGFNAIAIRLPVEETLLESQRRAARKWTKALSASTAVVCAAYIAAKSLAMNYSTIASALSLFMQDYPLLASIAICGTNGITADGLSQVKSWKQQGGGLFQFQPRSTLAALSYSGLFLGVLSNTAYTKLIPFLFGVESNVKTILACAAFDNFCLAPMFWLLGAYIIKGLFFGTSPKQALNNYIQDVKTGGLLTTYWKLWIPAQIFSFSCVPKSMRVTFMAGMSFIWFLILNSISSKKEATS